MSRQVLTYPDLPNLSLQYLPLAGGALTGNLAIGTTLAPWGGGQRALQFGVEGALWGNATISGVALACNTYYDGAGFKAIGAAGAANLTMTPSYMAFSFAPNGAAGSSQSFNTRMYLDEPGSLAIGATPPPMHPQRKGLRISDAGVLFGGPGYNALEIRCNSYQNASNQPVALAAAPAISLSLVNDTIGLANAPAVAAGAVQTFAGRLSMQGDGTFIFYPGSGGTSLYLHAGNATNSRIATGTGNLELSAQAGVIHPSYDNTMQLGAGNVRWTQVYAVAGTINTCSAAVKEIIGTVNDTVALGQLMGLPAIYRFHYKHYVPVEGATPDTPPEEAYRLEVDTTQEFLGPVAEEMPMDMKVGEFEGGNVNTEGHLMASLRGAVKEYRDRITDLANRMTILEGRLPA